MIKAGVIGAAGYTGAELLRLLPGHAQIQVTAVTSATELGKRVSDVYPGLRGVLDLAYSARDTEAIFGCDVVFFATPNATAMHQVPELLKKGIKVIDLSADFRLKDPRIWADWYGQEHACPELLSEAVYGLPEINRESIREARLVANPGCYPTAVLLGFLPLLEQKLADPRSLIADAKSGISGAGRKESLTTQFCETSDSIRAYSVDGHRHLPEILQCLNQVSETRPELVFVPHLAPMIRGIHATLYAELTDQEADLQGVFEQRYAGEPFVDVMPAGSCPDTRGVRGGNTCRIACYRPQNGNTAVILAVEDNLVKGAAGQAIQNMNIMFGFPETEGISRAGLSP
jgi:N-acetyl-gamma-glutamyl-phosphate reductase